MVGVIDPGLRALLADVLRDLGVEVVEEGTPDVVVAMVTRADVSSVIACALELAHTAPVVAVIPFEDDALADVARRRGADLCYTLTGPLCELVEAIDEAVTPAAQTGS